MAQKKSRKDKGGKKKADKGPKLAKTKLDKKTLENDTRKGSKKHADSPAAPPLDAEAESAPAPNPKLTHEDALALAEAIVEMVNDGAQNPVAFFVTGEDALGRELIQLQGGSPEDMSDMVPVVLDAPQVRRIAMLTIADEMIWRRVPDDE